MHREIESVVRKIAQSLENKFDLGYVAP